MVLGPGSWFSSVIPHLLVPELRQALLETRAGRLVTLDLSAEGGRGRGFTPEMHVEVLGAYAPDLHLDAVVADPGSIPDEALLRRVSSEFGARSAVVLQDRESRRNPRHDPKRLARCLRRHLRSWQDRPMAMASVKDRLARLDITKSCCRKAEVSALLRFGGGLHIVNGRIVVEAELDTGCRAPAPSEHRRGLRARERNRRGVAERSAQRQPVRGPGRGRW